MLVIPVAIVVRLKGRGRMGSDRVGSSEVQGIQVRRACYSLLHRYTIIIERQTEGLQGKLSCPRAAKSMPRFTHLFPTWKADGVINYGEAPE